MGISIFLLVLLPNIKMHLQMGVMVFLMEREGQVGG